MKGFSPRERLGLISLAIVVAAIFLMEKVVDLSGCQRAEPPRSAKEVETPPPQSTAQPGVGSEDSDNSSSVSGWIKRSERSEARLQSDSIRNQNRKKGGKSGVRKKSGNKDKSNSRNNSPNRRSFRDEEIK